MRILQVMKWISSVEDTGGKIRSFRIGRALSAFAQVDAAGFVLPGDDPDGGCEHLSHYQRLFPLPICRGAVAAGEALRAFAGGLSLRTGRFSPAVFSSFMKNIVTPGHYDAIQVEELPLMSAVCGRLSDTPVVYSSHNVESALSPDLFARRNVLLRQIAGIEALRTLIEEQKAMARSCACLAVSEHDRDALVGLAGGDKTPVYVLPNCAPDRFQPGPPAGSDAVLLTTGSFGWYPNREGLLWFLDEVLPVLRRENPSLLIRVAGSGIDSWFRRILAGKGIQIHPDVPDMLPFLQEARLLFVPLRIGAGTRIKILEAWAAGLPVISTSCGAEGLNGRPDGDILIADDAASFARAMRAVYQDDRLYARLRSEGLNRAQSLRWSSLAGPLKTIYADILRGAGGKP